MGQSRDVNKGASVFRSTKDVGRPEESVVLQEENSASVLMQTQLVEECRAVPVSQGVAQRVQAVPVYQKSSWPLSSLQDVLDATDLPNEYDCLV